MTLFQEYKLSKFAVKDAKVFFLSSGYCSVLRAIFFLPLKEKQIDSNQDILASGLPWDKIIYGSETEQMLAASKDPIVKEIWDRKKIATGGRKGLDERVFISF